MNSETTVTSARCDQSPSPGTSRLYDELYYRGFRSTHSTATEHLTCSLASGEQPRCPSGCRFQALPGGEKGTGDHGNYVVCQTETTRGSAPSLLHAGQTPMATVAACYEWADLLNQPKETGHNKVPFHWKLSESQVWLCGGRCPALKGRDCARAVQPPDVTLQPVPPLVSLGRPGLSCPETDRRWKDAGCHTASCPALPGSTMLTSELSSADSVQRYESHSWLFSFFSFFFLKTKLDKLILDTTIWKWNSTVGETQTSSFQNLLQSYHNPNSVALAHGQTCRSTGTWLRAQKQTLTFTISWLSTRCRDHLVGEMVSPTHGARDSWITGRPHSKGQKVGPFLKNWLRMDHRPKCKWKNYKTLRRKQE